MLKIAFKSAILLMGFFINGYCYCQEGSRILLYSNKTDFLVPFIRSTLQEMISIESGKKLFSRADNLNLLFVNTNADKLLRNNLDYNFPDQSFHSTKNTTLQDSIFNAFINNDYFLLVNENTLQDKIEFQLTLYKVIRDTSTDMEKKNFFPIKNIISPISENDFFINITSSNYLAVLKNQIKRLFPETNFITKYIPILTGNVASESEGRFKVARNDTISLDISDIYDEDTPIEQIKFVVQVKGLELSGNEQSFYLAGKGTNFKIVFKKTARYRILIFANDGSNEIQPKVIEISVVEVPKLFAYKNNFNRNHILSFFQNFKEHSILISVPLVVVENTDSAVKLDFHVLNQNKVGESEKRFIDSIIKLQSQIKNSRIHSITSFPSRGHDSIYISKIKKINDNLYRIDIRVNTEEENNVFNIYGVENNLRTNYESIKLKQNAKGFLTMGTGIRNGLIKVGNTTCLCGSDSTQSISFTQNLLEVKFMPYSYKFLSLGVLGGMSFLLSKHETLGKNAIVLNYKSTVDLGIFISANFASNSWNSNIELGYYSKQTFTGYDSTFKNFSLENFVYTGFWLGTNIYPFKYSHIGFSLGYEIIGQKRKNLLFKGYGINAGIVFRY